MKPACWRRSVVLAALVLSVQVAIPVSVDAQPVVQALPGPEAMRLNDALNRLARDPRDVSALVDAGDAAMALGDYSAAEGFYRRASETAPGHAGARAGLAGALALGGDPYSAIPLFEEAARTGADAKAIAPERGLAYDLVGANAMAQEQYRLVLARDGDGEIRRRLALSLAIGGDGAAAEDMLLPLLRQQDKPSWRMRAFILAILGKNKEAVDVTNALLPADLAASIIPYLRYMAQLTPAQQAAAANLGRFPRASEVGRDDPRVAAFASIATPRTKVAAVDAALVPQGEPLGTGRKRSARRSGTDTQAAEDSGSKSRSRKEKRSRRKKDDAENVAQVEQPRVAPPEPRPGREIAAASQPSLASTSATADPGKARTGSSSARASSEQSSSPPPSVAAPSLAGSSSEVTKTRSPGLATSTAKQVAAASTLVKTSPDAAVETSSGVAVAPPPTATRPEAPAIAAAAPGFDLAKLPSTVATGRVPSGGQPQPQPPGAPVAGPTEPATADVASFADMFGDIGKPVSHAAPASGAVDIRKIEPAKPKPPPPQPAPKPAPPSHPSRIWVQFGIGQSLAALKYDWRKLNRQQAAVLKGHKAWVSDLGQTNRMLTGPFESRKAANDFLAELARAGMDGPYLWISPAGQVVEPLSE